MRRTALALAAGLLAAAAAGCGGGAEFQVHYDAGREHLGKRDWARAITEFEEALKADEESVDVRLGLGDAYTGAQRWPDALRVTERIFRRLTEADVEPKARVKAFRRLGVLTLREAWAAGDTAGLQRAATWFDKWLALEAKAYEAHLGKGLSLLKLQRWFDSDPKRDDAWQRLLEAGKQAADRPEAPYFRAMAGDRSGQVPARDVADAFRVALNASNRQRKEGPYPEMAALALDYETLATEGILEALRKSPTGAATDEKAARAEAEGLVKRLAAAKQPIPAAIEAWLGMGAQVGTGGGSPDRPPPAAAAPPKIVTEAWSGERLLPVGRAYTFEVEAEGKAKPEGLHASIDGRDGGVTYEVLRSEPFQLASDEPGWRTRFRVTAPVALGVHRIALIPVDSRGGRALLPWVVVIRGREARIDIVAVGCEGPEGSGWAPGAEADAKAVAEALATRLGVPSERRRVLVGSAATVEGLKNAFQGAVLALDATDTLVVHLAAAGGTAPDGAPAVALRGKGTEPDWLRLADLVLALKRIRAGKVLCVIDAGFAGNGGRTLGSGGAAPDPAALAEALGVPDTKRAILLAAVRGTALTAGAAPRGLCSVTLAEALTAPEADANGDGALSADELAAFVTDLATFRAASFGVVQDPVLAGDASLVVAPAPAAGK